VMVFPDGHDGTGRPHHRLAAIWLIACQTTARRGGAAHLYEAGVPIVPLGAALVSDPADKYRIHTPKRTGSISAWELHISEHGALHGFQGDPAPYLDRSQKGPDWGMETIVGGVWLKVD
jgi:hypothetical protein